MGNNNYLKTEKKVTGNGLFISWLQCPREIESGGTARFTVQFEHQKDGCVPTSGVTANIYQGINKSTRTLLSGPTTAVQDKFGACSWFIDYTVPSSQGSGPIYITWSATYQSSDNPTAGALALQATQVLRVVNPGRD